VSCLLGDVAGGETVTESAFQRIRDDHVQAMLQLRYHPAEREGIQRMLREGIIERNKPSKIMSISTEAAARAWSARELHPGPAEALSPVFRAPSLRSFPAAAGSLPCAPCRRTHHEQPSIDNRGDLDMSETGTTQFVPSASDGSYTRPPSIQQRISEQLRKLPKVDANGWAIPSAAPDPSIVQFVAPAGAPPTMGEALSAVAAQVGADVGTLLDSQSFCEAIGGISPADTAGIQAAIADHQPPPSRPGMAPNRAQGASNASAPGRSSGSSADQIHALVAARLSR
jgi:hypothetical protein